ncbi:MULTISPECIES: PhoH family protein [Alcaligenes]|jgi:PhoH-like ATPase|uniref:PhoH family protein n=1 Tax=Alcaligenes TaxID=507 RepID=UPI000D52BE7E|nr:MULTISPECIES: PhoH family protein [Alcaligenes]AWG35361.1 ribonuclease [Alcaligenes aquatilis]MCC9164121.1 PhoH family protein [Alcaligenes sp. MMA]QXR37010.1 PhoH family protein [Alcaligenes aquatilis]UYY88338.1 PhoH family protein [Alcaligenes sp. SMD-FA]HBQ89586.1 ribonuclease [Alcaligenes faecalis]
MPLPTLPTKLGTLLSEKDDSVILADPPVPLDEPESPPASPNAPARKAAVEPRAKKTAPAKTAPAAPAAKTAPASAAKPAPSKSAAASPVQQPKPTTNTSGKRTRLAPTQRKLFVLDTNVLLHDSNSLFKFEEHDIFLPMMVLEELDHQKKGLSEVARNARQVSRSLEGLVGDHGLDKPINLDGIGNTEALGAVTFQTSALDTSLPIQLPLGKADNAILAVVNALTQSMPKREVVLVSKDINMRLKAKALGLLAEDYRHDHVLDDSDLLYDGVMPLPDNFWTKHGKNMESWQQGGTTFYRISGPLCSQFMVNQFVFTEGDDPLYAQVRETAGNTAVLATLRDYSHGKNNVWGITARNREQNFALNLLMNPDFDFISLLGHAGTGKTLLALASALTQTLETKRYNEIIITRATVPVGDDIGFLPGTEEEKMQPWMGALEDNLEVLHLGTGKSSGNLSNPQGTEAPRNSTMELVRSKIKVKSLSFMRGRTFMNKFLIIDEAQNLTPKQMKTLVTRAGPGTKIVCLGNIAQIDTPYLTEGSSGLTYVVDRFKGWPHAGHITLQRGERSRLADYASDAL